MRRIFKIIPIIVPLFLFLGLLFAIGAQTGNPGTGEQSRSNIELSKEDIPRIFEVIRIWKLVDDLELNEDQLLAFLPKFKEMEELRRKYYRDRHDSIKKMSKLLETNPTENQLKSAIDEFTKAEADFYQRYRKIRDSINSVLTIKQQAKFVVFEDKYRDDMRSLMRNLRDLSSLREQRLGHQPEPLKEKK